MPEQLLLLFLSLLNTSPFALQRAPSHIRCLDAVSRYLPFFPWPGWPLGTVLRTYGYRSAESVQDYVCVTHSWFAWAAARIWDGWGKRRTARKWSIASTRVGCGQRSWAWVEEASKMTGLPFPRWLRDGLHLLVRTCMLLNQRFF